MVKFLHNQIRLYLLIVCFFLLAGTAVGIALFGPPPKPLTPCDLADDAKSQLEYNIQVCNTEMCVVYFIDHVETLEEECLVDVTDEALKRNPNIMTLPEMKIVPEAN